MAILERYVDPAGKIRILWQSDQTNEVYHFKFESEPTNQKLQQLSDERDSFIEYHSIEVESIDVTFDKQSIVQIIHRIKDNPNTTFNQYNSYLNGLDWKVSIPIKYFIYRFALKLSDRKNVQLQNLTESVVFIAVRNFIVNTPIKKLMKMIFNQTEL